MVEGFYDDELAAGRTDGSSSHSPVGLTHSGGERRLKFCLAKTHSISKS